MTNANATYRRLSVTAQSTWKKSAARSVPAWARRNTRQHPSFSRWRRDAVHPQDLADGGGGYPVAEPAQLALDPDHAPPGVLTGQAYDQHDELVGDRRAPRWPGLAPLGCRKALMPAEQRAGSHDPPSTQALGHDPGQRSEDGPVGPGHAQSGVGPAQHGYL